MDVNYKGILPKNFLVNERYSVMFFIKQGSNAETYRVKGKDGKLYFLKLFNYAKLHRSAFDSEQNLLEIEFLKSIDNQNIVNYEDNGELIYEGKKSGYLVLNFITGETLAERIIREPISSLYDLRQIVLGILNGLNYLHSLPDPIIHNEITPQNIMLDLSEDIVQAKIIDFGYARSFHQSSKSFSKEGLNLNYVASECFNNFYSPQSDLFSLGAVIYHLLFGTPPWFKDISRFKADRTKAEDVILEERQKKLPFPNVSKNIVDFEESFLNIIKKALQDDPEDRFQSAKEFIRALNGEIEVEDVDTVQKVKSDDKPLNKIQNQKAKGKGFDAIAGLDDLKSEMRRSVIDILQNPEKAERYGAKLPNGMVLYGPPGCGKTYFAKCFAEEVGFNFIMATPSTLKSRYVNATQENIATMFEDAEKNAPTIIFIDEINELLPNRDSDSHEMAKSAVNEMLAQMDRTGEKGIFIIGATNYPNMIDPAMLRSGRLEKKFYLPPPDSKLRKSLFEMSLSARKKVLDFGIDYGILSKLTENYVSSDIESIVNETTSIAMAENTRITMALLEKVIKSFQPFPKSELEKYEVIKAKMDGENTVRKNSRNSIGFKI
ncbi:AAA family ATPase [Pedobacter changchengzhani]|uniref:AAA family ATPase n=1 Tax=Pedobacter changchengzhani TaxID=2529274 RepID=A0A4V3A0K9_9SPHI|nr:AAA family ATPase [Pedobacter changchengzhani]TDG37553.1 AAA family ATPase [Pedobacter changchengzhani]